MAGLAFPCGVAPGFDPAHMASASCTFSAIARGNTFIDFLTGKAGVVGGAPVAAVSAIIGPSVKYAGGSDDVAFAGKKSYGANAAPLTDTMAAIFFLNSSAQQQAFLSLGVSGTDTGYSYIATTSTNTTPGIGHQSFTVAASTWAGALSVPIFMAASQNLSSATGATQTANIVAVRMDTGQMFANTTTNSGYSAGSRNGTYHVGSRGAVNLPALANISAVMATDSFMSLAALVQWAQDPWSFWYPK